MSTKHLATYVTVCALPLLAACSSDDTATPQIDAGSQSDATSGVDGGVVPEGGSNSDGGSISGGSARKLAMALRGKSNFMVGMGNDLDNNHDNDGAYTLGASLDLHYAYLVGLLGAGGWPDWNANGTFIDVLFQSADKHGTTPMYSLYSMAAWGENNMPVLTNDAYMKPYWDGAKLLFQRLAVFAKPAALQIEPDFWGYAMQYSPDGKKAVHVKSLAPDCSSLSDDFIGMAQCFVTLRNKYAPKVALAFHVSEWGGTVPATLSFMKAIGADKADFWTTDALDRDAGCFEQHTDPNCQRGGKTGWYWDEANKISPTYHEHFAWVKQIVGGLGLPVMWWQVPFGVPSDTPGGSAGKYRDNHVHYFFAHPDELIAAGGVGMVYGTGAGNQTYITSDNGQFKAATTQWFASPSTLP
ncbi:hypothetical protein BH09MYX1_BH09MYX1_27400 [soil metagenome]